MRLGPAVELVIEGGRLLERTDEMRRGGPFGRWVGAVEAKDAERVQQLGDRAGEAACDSRSGLVVALQPGERGIPELGRRQSLGERLERGDHTVAERLPVHRRERCVSRPRGKCGGGDQAIGRDPRCGARLGEVVIVAGQPEDRHHRPAPAPLKQPGQGGRAEPLVDGIERPSEEPGLLAGGDGQRTGRQQPRQLPLAPGGGDESRRQRGIERRGTRRRCLEGVLERRGDEAQAHVACPRRMVRGESERSGEAS